MKDRGKATLFLILAFLIFFGSVILVYFFREFQDSSCSSFNCYCIETGICRESDKNGDIPADSLENENPEDDDEEKPQPTPDLGSNELTNTNLEFNSEFVSFPINEDLLNSDPQVEIRNINYSGDTLEVVLDQKQSCIPDENVEGSGEPQKQSGFYRYEDGELILFNLLSPVINNQSADCTVRIVYTIKDFNKPEDGDFTLKFKDEFDNTKRFELCQYNDKFFLDGDVYQATDDCNLCSCENGESVCTEKSCDEEEDEVKQSVYKDRSDYDKFEAPETDDECFSSSQCYTGGCQSEICSPVNGVSSVCSIAIDKVEGAKCGCYDNKCIWVKD